jgi:hypothetical protein
MNIHVAFVTLLYVCPPIQLGQEGMGLLQVPRALLVGSQVLCGGSPEGKGAVLLHDVSL